MSDGDSDSDVSEAPNVVMPDDFAENVLEAAKSTLDFTTAFVRCLKTPVSKQYLKFFVNKDVQLAINMGLWLGTQEETVGAMEGLFLENVSTYALQTWGEIMDESLNRDNVRYSFKSFVIRKGMDIIVEKEVPLMHSEAGIVDLNQLQVAILDLAEAWRETQNYFQSLQNGQTLEGELQKLLGEDEG